MVVQNIALIPTEQGFHSSGGMACWEVFYFLTLQSWLAVIKGSGCSRRIRRMLALAASRLLWLPLFRTLVPAVFTSVGTLSVGSVLGV